jgi:hypothetical protein
MIDLPIEKTRRDYIIDLLKRHQFLVEMALSKVVYKNDFQNEPPLKMPISLKATLDPVGSRNPLLEVTRSRDISLNRFAEAA